MAGGYLGASFYAYAACVAGGILLLNLHAGQNGKAARCSDMMGATQESLNILEKMGLFWDHASKMVRFPATTSAIYVFTVDPSFY